MAQLIRKPNAPSIVDILDWIPVATQSFLEVVFYPPVCWYSDLQNKG